MPVRKVTPLFLNHGYPLAQEVHEVRRVITMREIVQRAQVSDLDVLAGRLEDGYVEAAALIDTVLAPHEKDVRDAQR